MTAISELVSGIKGADELLAEKILEPDLDRKDWAELGARVRLLRDRIETDVLGRLEAALAEADDPEIVLAVRRRVAQILASAAVPIHAASRAASGEGSVFRLPGDELGFADLVKRAIELEPRDEVKEELRAALEEPELFCRLQYGRWLVGEDNRVAGDRIFKDVTRRAKSPALKRAAKDAYHAPRAISSAPPLFRLNGCGVGLYGSRDEQSDGWYVATYFICIFFLPVFPLTAYLVRRADSNSYQFAARQRLGPIARAWRALMLAGAVGGVAVLGVQGWLDSPERKAGIALERAQALEAQGEREKALAAYNELLTAYGSSTRADVAAEAVVRLAAQAVPEKATKDHVDAIGRVVSGFYDLPLQARGRASAFLEKRLLGWADRIGDGDVDSARASLTVLELAVGVGATHSVAGSATTRRDQARERLADRLANTRPLAALRLYVRLSSAEAQKKALGILDAFGAAPSLWIEAEKSVELWIAANNTSNEQGRIVGKLSAARALHAEDAALAREADEKALAKAVAERPQHQELAVALANKQRARGELKAALATLEALGPEGRLTGETIQLLAACRGDAGDLAAADKTLSALLDERLPAFLEAQREYGEASRVFREQRIAELKGGRVASLERELKSVPEKDRRELVFKWLADKTDQDPGLKRLREAFFEHAIVVPVSLKLGMLKLRQAHGARAAEKKRLTAEAEKTFLSIRQEAEGNPSFHLGLGEVYHRLGRIEEGEREFAVVLEKHEAALSMAVAGAYRELGVTLKARKVAEGVFESEAVGEMKTAAAVHLALLASDLAEKEAWLLKAGDQSVSGRNMLREVQAHRLVQDGKLAEADRLFSEVAASYGKGMEHDSTAANNAALANLGRYSATGDAAHLVSAVRGIETAARLTPQNSIVVSNLATSVEHLGLVTVLEKWLKNQTLALGSDDAEHLTAMLLSGPLREKVLEALGHDASLRRANELSEQEQILAPQRSGAYARKLRWLLWRHDEVGLAGLFGQLKSLPPIDAEEEAEARAKWATGTRDAEGRKQIATMVRRAQDRVKRAEQAGHKPTQAAAWALLGRALNYQTALDPSPATVDAMLEAARKAAELWPEGGFGKTLPATLLEAGLLRAAAESKALKQALDGEARIYGDAFSAFRAAQGKDGKQVLSALGARPELVEAVKLRHAAGARSAVGDLLLAVLAGDAELEKEAREALSKPEAKLEARIEALLHPGLPREKATLELVEKVPK